MISIILTSRSLMCSSASFSLLFIPSRVFFVIEFLISDWVFFIYSSSLLKFCVHLSPNSINILTTIAINSLSGKLFFIICLSRVFSCFFS